jgi:hypothetical protein
MKRQKGLMSSIPLPLWMPMLSYAWPRLPLALNNLTMLHR